jgi:hypothetical protein
MDETVASRKSSEEQLLVVGTTVDVRSRYIGTWSRGFEVAEIVGDAYRVRRLSDSSVLPTEFSVNDVSAQRPNKTGSWWY